MRKRLLVVVLTVFLIVVSVPVYTLAYTTFTNKTIGTGGFLTLAEENISGSDWTLNLTKVDDGPAVGVVFVHDTQTWASPLYVFRTTGWRTWPYRTQYQNTTTAIDWRMRKDNDYTGTVTVSGTFYP